METLQEDVARQILKDDLPGDDGPTAASHPVDVKVEVDTSWIGPWETLYIQKNSHILQGYRDAVQFPPRGPFTLKDVKWDFRPPNSYPEVAETNGRYCRRNVPESGLGSGCSEGAVSEKRYHVAYIPWERVEEFVEGESKRRSDVKTRFLKRPKGKPPGHEPRHNTGLLTFWYECQYGPKDLSDKVLTITPDMETKKPKYNVKGKLIPNGRGKAQPRIGAAANGMSIKRGCVCRFQVKQLYYFRDVAEIVYYNPRHENSASLVVHGDVLPGERGRFEKQIPVELRNWVLSSLRSSVSSNKILSTHRAEVMRLVAEGVRPERCHFLREWDVRNIAKELRKTEYQRDDNNAESLQEFLCFID